MRFSPESCGAVTGRTQATARTAAAVLLPQRSNTLNSKGLAPVSRKASRTAADGRSPLVQSAITLCRAAQARFGEHPAPQEGAASRVASGRPPVASPARVAAQDRQSVV